MNFIRVPYEPTVLNTRWYLQTMPELISGMVWIQELPPLDRSTSSFQGTHQSHCRHRLLFCIKTSQEILFPKFCHLTNGMRSANTPKTFLARARVDAIALPTHHGHVQFFSIQSRFLGDPLPIRFTSLSESLRNYNQMGYFAHCKRCRVTCQGAEAPNKETFATHSSHRAEAAQHAGGKHD